MLTDVITKYCKMLMPSVKEQEVRLFLESSPCYPSLLSVIDTLLFIGVKTKAVKTDSLNFDEIQFPFLVHLVINEEQVVAIAKKTKNPQQIYLYSLNEQKWIPKPVDKIKVIWDGIMIFPIRFCKESKRNVYSCKVLTLVIFLTISVGISSLVLSSFVCILGLSFSLFLYFEEERIIPASMSRLCHIGKVLDCEKVTKSDYAAIGPIKLIDLSVAYFASQLMLALVGIVTIGNVNIHTIYLPSAIGGMPILAYSFFAQLKIKKICPFCVLLMLCLITEGVIATCQKDKIDKTLLVFEGMLFVSFIAMLWQKSRYGALERTEEQIKCSLLKFKRNNDFFSKKGKQLIPCTDAISLGQQTKNEIVLFISPECPHCHQALFEITKSLKSNPECPYNIKLIICSTSKDGTETVRSWLSMYLANPIEFKEILQTWINGKQVHVFPTCNLRFQQKVETLMQKFQAIAIQNKIHSYPRIAINGVLFSEDYSSSDIKYIMVDQYIREK